MIAWGGGREEVKFFFYYHAILFSILIKRYFFLIIKVQTIFMETVGFLFISSYLTTADTIASIRSIVLSKIT